MFNNPFHFMGGNGGGSGGTVRPIADDLQQWLLALRVDESTLPDNSGEGINAELVQSACITLNGVDQRGVTAYTSAGGNVDWAASFTFTEDPISTSVFATTTPATEGIEFYRYADGEARISILGRQSKLSTSKFFKGDRCDVVFSASNNELTFYKNRIRDSTHTFSFDFNLDKNGTMYIGYDVRNVAYKTVPVTDFKWSLSGSWDFAELSGTTSYDTSGNGNNITWEVGSGNIDTMRAGRQDAYHANYLNGGSKVLVFDGISGIGLSDIVTTPETTFELRFKRIKNTGSFSVVAGSAATGSDGRLYVGWDDNGQFILGYGSGSLNLGFSDYEWHTAEHLGFGLFRFDGVEYDLSGNSFGVGSIFSLGMGSPSENYGSAEFARLVINERNYQAATVYGEILPDSLDPLNQDSQIKLSGGVSEKFYPALSTDPGTDVRGLACTNRADGKTNPNCETKHRQTDSALFNRALFSDDGLTARDFTYGEMIEYPSYQENVVLGRITDAQGLMRTTNLLTYDISKTWNADEKIYNQRYLYDEGPQD